MSSGDVEIASLLQSFADWGDGIELQRKMYDLKILNLNSMFRHDRNPIPIYALGNSLGRDRSPQLESLLLRNNGIAGSEMEKLAPFFKAKKLRLKTIDLSDNAIGLQGASVLSEAFMMGYLPYLQEISLSGCHVGSDGMTRVASALSTISQLKVLDLDGNDVSDDGLRSLAESLINVPNLEELRLSANCIGPAAAQALAEALKLGPASKLKVLNLDDNDICDDGLRALAASLISFSNLEELRLAANRIGEAGAKALAEALKLGSASKLKVLNIGSNKDIDYAGHVALADAIKSGSLPLLEQLLLYSSRSGTFEAYAKVLISHLPSLTVLDFHGSGVHDSEVAILGLAHVESGGGKKLRYIDLADNEIGDEGMLALLGFFTSPHSSELREILLNGNQMGDEGLLALAKALESGKLDHLDVLGVRFNESADRGATALVAALYRNTKLKMELRCDWHSKELELKANEYRERNVRIAGFTRVLRGQDSVAATSGKVYLCGNPSVGKTTLSKSLGRNILQALCMRERRRHTEKPTRGIEVSELISKGGVDKTVTKLSIWDMAGQQEYHLVHNAFLPDLAFAAGKATTFVVVCNSREPQTAETNLRYWMRFIASNTVKDIGRRDVWVVVNRYDGDTRARAAYWRPKLRQLQDQFKDYLEIHPDPFVADVRKQRAVKDLKKMLMDHSRKMLTGTKVPEICNFIQNNLLMWTQERKHFPVIRWDEFITKIEISPSNEILEAAAEYLSEAGIIVYIRKELMVPGDVPCISLVVLDPNWFCKKIVGHMFMPEEMLEGEESYFKLKVDENDGSISTEDFGHFFQSLLRDTVSLEQWHIADLVSILQWLGLCYKYEAKNGLRVEEKIFIPALIKDSNQNESSGDLPWSKTIEPGEGQWVMGFSVEHARTEITLAPIALFHRFQVELANIYLFDNTEPENEYVAGKYFISFKCQGMAVLVTVNASKNHPTFDHIDILVRPVWNRDTDPAESRKDNQVELAGDIVEKLLRMCYHICPGIDLVQKVVWPWLATERRPSGRDKNIDVKAVQKRVQEKGPAEVSMWTVGGGTHQVKWVQLLTKKEINLLLGSVHEPIPFISFVREGVEEGVFPPDVLVQSSSNAAGDSEPEQFSRGEKMIFEAINNMRKDVTAILTLTHQIRHELGALTEMKQIIKKVQDLGRISLQDKEKKFPQLMYLGKSNGILATLKGAIAQHAQLHFLCEAGYNDYRVHPVEGQKGCDVSQLKDWARKLAPALKISIALLFITAKVAAGFVGPGLDRLIPNFVDWQQMSTLSEAICLATGYSRAELDELLMGVIPVRNFSGDSQHNHQQIYGNSRKVVEEMLGKLNMTEFQDKVGLLKVVLINRDGTTDGVVWICKVCYAHYRAEGRVRDL